MRICVTKRIKAARAATCIERVRTARRPGPPAMQSHAMSAWPRSVSASSQPGADAVMGQRHGHTKESRRAVCGGSTPSAAAGASKPATVSARAPACQPEVDALSSALGRQVSHHVSLQRPQSAMSSPLVDRDRADSAGGQSSLAQAAVWPQTQSAGPSPSRQQAPSRVKITRVRINSTSEQIQDPNWLIKMSQEQEQRSREKRNHLKMLHRKLKSTIIGGSEQSRKSPSEYRSSSSAARGATPPITPPRTPVKVPVSILKQRSAQTVRQVADSRPRAARAQAIAKSAGSATAATPEPIAAVGVQSAQVPPSTQIQSSSLVQPKVVRPLCADGEVKVSGWKRKNLIAKTLGHLDEIRGNQRPIFVPTTIHVPSSSTANEPKHQSATRSKFAEVVREALLRKADVRNICDETSLPNQGAPSALSEPPDEDVQVRAMSVEPASKPREAGQARLSWSGQQQVPSSGSQTPKRTPSGGQQSQLQVQLLSQLLASASESTPTQGASQRDFKLQHKNNQLLQSLRRQSNELAAVEANRHSAGQSDSSSASPKAGLPHRNDWKRLTSKLALLTSRQHQSSPNSRQASHLTAGDSASSGSKALRLTLSNQEERSTFSVSNALLLPASDKRKLSSSSMVVQPSSNCSTSDSARNQADTLQPGYFTRRTSVGAQQRRCSDSETHRKSSIHHEPPKSVPSGSPSGQAHAPVIVRGDDLRLLLQVSSSTGGSRLADSIRLGGGGGSSEQLVANRRPSTGSQASGNSLERSKVCSSEVQGKPEESRLHESADADYSPAASGKDERLEQRERNPPDLSSIVKKTSRVAFFQQKLRKIRRNQAMKHAQGAELKMAPELGKRAEPAAEQLLVDPMLIGDAIEMFLRSAMQQSAGNADKSQYKLTEAAPAEPTPSMSGEPGEPIMRPDECQLLQVVGKSVQGAQAELDGRKSSNNLQPLAESQSSPAETRVMSS